MLFQKHPVKERISQGAGPGQTVLCLISWLRLKLNFNPAIDQIKSPAETEITYTADCISLWAINFNL